MLIVLLLLVVGDIIMLLCCAIAFVVSVKWRRRHIQINVRRTEIAKIMASPFACIAVVYFCRVFLAIINKKTACNESIIFVFVYFVLYNRVSLQLRLC